MQQIAIYVPSTVNVSQACDNTKQVAETQILLAQLFGGFTTYEATGGYVTNSNQLVTEKITIVTSFVGRAKKAQKEAIFAYAEQLRDSMTQESILVQIGAKIHFI